MRLSSGVILAPLLLAGCASYVPLPLEDDATAGLSPPVAAVLTQAAAAIRRPYLIPTTIDLGRPLDGNAIATLAVIGNPDLRALRTRAGVSDAQAFAARLLPDPTFSIGASPVLSGPDPYADIVSALGLDLATLRTRGARLAQARAQAAQVRLDLAWAEWQTAGQARIQAVRVAALSHVLALATASRDAARSLLDRTLRAAGRGDLSPDQLQAARVSAYAADEQYRSTERDLSAARSELARLIGLPPATELVLAPETPLDAAPSADALLSLARDKRADLAALRQGYAAQEAAVHQAVLEQFPTLGLTVNGGRDTTGNVLIGPAVDFTLPLWNRNRGAIAVERATRDALRAEYAARLAQARAEIAAAAGGIAIDLRQRDTARADLPALQRFAEASRRAASRGDIAAATAETAGQALRDKLLSLAQAEQNLAEHGIALELLTGTPREGWPR